MKRLNLISPVLLLLLAVPFLSAQSCQTRDEIPDATRTAIENSAQQIFTQAASGDVNTLQANSIPMLQSNFSGIAGAVNDNKPAFAGAKPQLRTTFLLDTGANASPDGQFYCGIFGANGMSANGAEFVIPNLPVGKYAVVIQDFIGPKGPYALSTILQDMNGWKLAGFYIRPAAASGHDGLWYLKQAREYYYRHLKKESS